MVVDMFKEYPEVAGVFVGGCITRGEGSSFRAKAHAHINKNFPNPGWICVRSSKRLYSASGKPSNTMIHELAHILTMQGHTQKWADLARTLGCRIPKNRYRYVK
jgi:hypothetical protein